MRYTPAGGSITIRFARDAGGGAVLAVRDTGYGIPAAHLPRITERFYRVSTSRSRESGGTGLGLSIVKHVLSLHQARLEIDSEVGRGSTFSCHFGAERVRPRDRRRCLPSPEGLPMNTPAAIDRARRQPTRCAIPALYFNRELSQLDFNFRVLAQAQDPQVPLLERLRYLCISCTNLDEFFEIRAATVRHAQDFGVPPRADGMAPATVLKRIHDRAAELVDAQYRCWNEVLRPALNDAGVRVLGPRQLEREADALAARRISATRSCRCCRRWAWTRRIRSRRSSTSRSTSWSCSRARTRSAAPGTWRSCARRARCRASSSCREEVSGGQHDFVFLSAVLSAFVDELFPGMEVKGAYQFRVTRNSELIVDEEEVENLALALRDELVGRGYLRAVRLEIAEQLPEADRAHAAGELRPAGERGLPHQRPGQPQPRDPGLRPGRSGRT